MIKLKLVLVLLSIMASMQLKAQKSYEAFQVEVVGSGKDLVLIPGAACSGDVWNATVASLKKDYTCHIITLAGYAGVPALAETPMLPQYQLALIAYIKEETNDPILMGHSIGGFLALQIASAEVDLLDRVIIVDALPFLLAASNPAMTEEMANNFPFEPMLNSYTQMADSTFYVMQKQVISGMLANQEKQEEVVSWSMASDRRTMAYTMNELMTDDLRDDIANIQVPVLVLGAWQSTYPFSKERQEAVYAQQYKAIANLTLEMADDARHFIMFDSPDWYMQQITEFMQ